MKPPRSAVSGRCYLHGDQREGHPGTFYCVSCDVFYDIEHFAGRPCSPGRGETHRAIHKDQQRNLRAMRRYLVKSRPDDAPNCIVGPWPVVSAAEFV